MSERTITYQFVDDLCWWNKLDCSKTILFLAGMRREEGDEPLSGVYIAPGSSQSDGDSFSILPMTANFLMPSERMSPTSLFLNLCSILGEHMVQDKNHCSLSNNILGSFDKTTLFSRTVSHKDTVNVNIIAYLRC